MEAPASPDLEVLARALAALRPELIRFASAALGAESGQAGEIVSAGIEKLLRAHDPAVPVVNPRALAYTTIRRLIIDGHRTRQRRGPEVSADAVEEPGEGGRRSPLPPAGPGHWTHDLEIRDLLEQLPEPQRSFYALITFEDVGVLEAQRTCGWPPKSPHYHYRLLNRRIAELMGLAPSGKEQVP